MPFEEDIEKAISDLVAEDPAVFKLVKQNVFSDIAGLKLKIGSNYITMQMISDQGMHHLGGQMTGLGNPLFQIDVWATGSKVRKNISDAILDVLDGFTGVVADTDIRRITLDNQASEFAPQGEGLKKGHYRRRMDFNVWYRRTVPTH